MGTCDKKTAFEMLDYFYEMGGNFIDTYALRSLFLFSLSAPYILGCVYHFEILLPALNFLFLRLFSGKSNGFQHQQSSDLQFLSSASNYQDEQSETWIGEWLAKTGRRDEMVIATKYCGPWKLHPGSNGMIQTNFGGGAAKNLHVCVEASLKKLQTSYIDLVSSVYLRPCLVLAERWLRIAD